MASTFAGLVDILNKYPSLMRSAECYEAGVEMSLDSSGIVILSTTFLGLQDALTARIVDHFAKPETIGAEIVDGILVISFTYQRRA